MWLNENAGPDLIEFDPATVTAGALQILTQLMRGAETMGIHFDGLGTTAPTACLCDLWDSSIPGLMDELGALGDDVIRCLTEYGAAMNEVGNRASQILADQAQAGMTSTIGGQGVDPSFGALLAQAIVNDGMNNAAGTWLGSTPSTSQVDILLAMQQNQGAAGIDATLAKMNFDANDHAAKVWLAPDGTSYAGQNDAGRDLYRDKQGDVGTINEVHKDKYDYNNNNDRNDNEVD